MEDFNKYERRRDLSGLHLRAAVESWKPYSHGNKSYSYPLSVSANFLYVSVYEDENGELAFKGFLAEVFHSLQDITNFTYSLGRHRQSTIFEL